MLPDKNDGWIYYPSFLSGSMAHTPLWLNSGGTCAFRFNLGDIIPLAQTCLFSPRLELKQMVRLKFARLSAQPLVLPV